MGWRVIIIGDEILRGKRQDRHFARAVSILAARGAHLDAALYLGDDRPRLTAALAASFATTDVVFCFGGIGATPDDHTRQAAAAALGLPLRLHPLAEAEIRARFARMGVEPTADRLALGEFPEGCRIIANPYNRIPGFSCGDHHFFPGFPQMAHPMLEWVLDSYYRERFSAQAEAEAAIVVWEGNEGTLLPLMRRIEADHPGIRVFSLPSLGTAEVPRHIELGVRGEPERVGPALAEICAEVARLGYRWERAATG